MIDITVLSFDTMDHLDMVTEVPDTGGVHLVHLVDTVDSDLIASHPNQVDSMDLLPTW